MPPRTRSELSERLSALTTELRDAMTLDGLTRDFKIFQRRRGHRHSTDDLLTAWYAATHAPDRPVKTLLDLGSGIGSVGLALAWYFEEAALTAIEVQRGSYRLLCENAWANGVEARTHLVHGDLRDAALSLLLASPPFDLVTGSPPYFDVKSGIVSADPQRAGARFELCGDVSDYCRAARHTLAHGGRFVFCFPTVQRARAETACAKARLAIVTSRDVIPKEGAPPLFSLFACRRAGDDGDDGGDGGAHEHEPPFTVRRADGQPTDEHAAARALFGMGDAAAR